MNRFRIPLLCAALITSVVTLGLSHAMAQTASPRNPAAMPADAHQWILSETNHARIVRQVPPGEPVVGQLQTTPAPGPQWQQASAAMPRDVRCFNKPRLEDNCNGYGHARM